MASPATRNSINWSPPISGHLKCNLDAGFAHGTNITEMGCCVRNHVVALVASYMNSRSPCMDVKEDETWVLLTYVIFDMDCKSIVDNIIKPSMDDFEFGNIIQDCRSIFSRNPTFSIGFVKRKVNEIAHKLTRMTSFFPSLYSFYHTILCIEQLLSNEMK